MALFIVIILIALIALTLYDHLSPSLPKNWQLSKSSVASALEASPDTSTYGQRLPAASSSHWSVSSDGSNTRAVRQFETPIVSPGHQYDPPLMYFSCYRGKLYAWLDTRLHAQSSAQDGSRVEIQLNGGPAVGWQRSTHQSLAAPDPERLLDEIERSRALTISLAFDDAPRQTLRLPLEGSQVLFDALAPCQR